MESPADRTIIRELIRGFSLGCASRTDRYVGRLNVAGVALAAGRARTQDAA